MPTALTQFSTVIFHCGGAGARPEKDGLSATAFPSGVRTIPVEATESIAPVVFYRREFREGSGGAGKQRGGLGQMIELGGAGAAPIALLCNFERVRNPARGRNGGRLGRRGRGRFEVRTSHPAERTANRAVARCYSIEVAWRRWFWRPACPRSAARPRRCLRRLDHGWTMHGAITAWL